MGSTPADEYNQIVRNDSMLRASNRKVGSLAGFTMSHVKGDFVDDGTDLFLSRVGEADPGMKNTDPLSNTTSWFQLTSGGSGAFSVCRTLYVDAVNGDDATAEVGNPALAWATLTAVRDAAVTEAGMVGEVLIRVMGCTYSDNNTDLARANVSWMFEPGAVVTASATIWVFGAFENQVWGRGQFSTTSGTVVLIGSGADVTFEADTMDSSGAATSTIETALGATNIQTIVMVRRILTGSGLRVLWLRHASGSLLLSTQQWAAVTLAAEIEIGIRASAQLRSFEITSLTGNVIAIYSGGLIDISANRITGLGAGTAVIQQTGGNRSGIRANLIESPSATVNRLVLVTNGFLTVKSKFLSSGSLDTQPATEVTGGVLGISATQVNVDTQDLLVVTGGELYTHLGRVFLGQTSTYITSSGNNVAIDALVDSLVTGTIGIIDSVIADKVLLKSRLIQSSVGGLTVGSNMQGELVVQFEKVMHTGTTPALDLASNNLSNTIRFRLGRLVSGGVGVLISNQSQVNLRAQRIETTGIEAGIEIGSGTSRSLLSIEKVSSAMRCVNVVPSTGTPCLLMTVGELISSGNSEVVFVFPTVEGTLADVCVECHQVSHALNSLLPVIQLETDNDADASANISILKVPNIGGPVISLFRVTGKAQLVAKCKEIRGIGKILEATGNRTQSLDLQDAHYGGNNAVGIDLSNFSGKLVLTARRIEGEGRGIMVGNNASLDAAIDYMNCSEEVLISSSNRLVTLKTATAFSFSTSTVVITEPVPNASRFLTLEGIFQTDVDEPVIHVTPHGSSTVGMTLKHAVLQQPDDAITPNTSIVASASYFPRLLNTLATTDVSANVTELTGLGEFFFDPSINTNFPEGGPP